MDAQPMSYVLEVEGVRVSVTRKRVKNFNLRVTRDGPKMSVPMHATKEQAEEVVKHHLEWLREQLARVSSMPKGPSGPVGEGMTFTVEHDDITVLVTRKRVKNYNMRISGEGELLMSAPMSASREDIERAVAKHAQWFRDARSRWEGRVVEGPERWVTGEKVLVWGEQLTLEVIEREGEPKVERAGEVLKLEVPPNTSEHYRSQVVEDFYWRELRARLTELLPACCERVGAYPTKVTLRRMSSRWGSCTKSNGRIRLNIALAECPPECTEAVLCHELCHLFEANHGPRFYARLDLAYPAWRSAQAWLDDHLLRSM